MRCAYCHDDLGLARHCCQACKTLLHRDCAQRLEVCPTLGCEQTTRRSETPLRGGYSFPWAGLSPWRLIPGTSTRRRARLAPDPEQLRRLHLCLWAAVSTCVFLQLLTLGARDALLSPEQAVHARWLGWRYDAGDWRYGSHGFDPWGGAILETQGGLLSGGPNGHFDVDYQDLALMELGPQGDDVYLREGEGSFLADLIALFPFLRFAACFAWISLLLFLFRKRLEDCGRLQQVLLLSAPTCWLSWWALQTLYLSPAVALAPLALLILGGAFVITREATPEPTLRVEVRAEAKARQEPKTKGRSSKLAFRESARHATRTRRSRSASAPGSRRG